jgi:hypothetical protein
MKRTLLLFSALALLAPAGASARYVELGMPSAAVNPACPGTPCEAAVRVTALQGRVSGGRKNPYYIRRDGHLIAFTLQLSQPTAEQVDFFNTNFGSPAQVRLSVLRQGRTRKTRLNYRLISQSDVYEVDRYFGSSPTFVLDPPLRVKKTNWIALTVPTWAPVFANNLTGDNWWRSSRAKGNCDPPESLEQFSMQETRSVGVFGCTYKGARLLYKVLYVPEPRETVESEDETETQPG